MNYVMHAFAMVFTNVSCGHSIRGFMFSSNVIGCQGRTHYPTGEGGVAK